jgi:hypothetical protein
LTKRGRWSFLIKKVENHIILVNFILWQLFLEICLKFKDLEKRHFLINIKKMQMESVIIREEKMMTDLRKFKVLAHIFLQVPHFIIEIKRGVFREIRCGIFFKTNQDNVCF